MTDKAFVSPGTAEVALEYAIMIALFIIGWLLVKCILEPLLWLPNRFARRAS